MKVAIEEIRRGRTPNPDILCNSECKFGAFLEHLAAVPAADGRPFDRVVSGHYARVTRGGAGGGGEGGGARLRTTPDDLKDQTYFLSKLRQEQLGRCSFPLGHLTKAEVRDAAARLGLPAQGRKDSQGICFLGKVKFEEFVGEHLGEWPGPLVDEQTGATVGFHRGFWFYTVGQRRGIRLPGGPWFVSRKDTRRNVVFISRHYDELGAGGDSFVCGPLSFPSGQPRDLARLPGLRVKVRHGPATYACRVSHGPGPGEVTARLDAPDQGLAAGQYAVFYDGDECVACGVMQGPADGHVAGGGADGHVAVGGAGGGAPGGA